MNAPTEDMVAIKLEQAQISQARTLSAQSGRHMLDVLEELSGLESDHFVMALGALLHYPVLLMSDLHTMTADLGMLSFTDSSRNECVVLRDQNDEMLIACADPFNTHLQSRMDLLVKGHVRWAVAHRKDIAAYLSRYEANLRAMDSMLPEDGEQNILVSGGEDLSLASISQDSSHVVKLVRSTLYDALKAGASDIHLETDLRGLTVKYRIDGVLTHVGSVTGLDLAEQAISRIKVMSDLDIAERRIPQDGRFRVTVQGRDVDMRVSIMPSILGEDAVLRILDRQSISDHINGLSLDYLGFSDDTMERFRLLASEPYGMLLVTGPTGSGKTTTLYAIISEINDGQDKIITIEDPVEYQLPGVLQIPVNEKKGLTFARGLRSILRHDPDKIMVGEIRDSETAQIAIQSALTGHLVFTSVHANNVFDVIGRFTNMGVDPYSFVSALNGIMAQRLVRVICPHCAVDDVPDAALLKKSGLTQDDVANFNFKRGDGCGHCRGTGFRSRKAIAEILTLNDELRELIVTREPVRKIKEAARRNGTYSMRESALKLVQSGETTLQEINRVTSMA